MPSSRRVDPVENQSRVFSENSVIMTFFKPIRIPALTTVLTPGNADRRLCPVRMLNLYLGRTQHLLPIKSDIVFISFEEGYDKVINMSILQIGCLRRLKRLI